MYANRWLSEASTCPTCRHSLPSQHHEVLPDASSIPASQPIAPQPAHPEGVESHQQAPESRDSPEITDAIGAARAQGSSAAAHMGARDGNSDAVSIDQQGAGEGASGHVHQFYEVQRVEGEEKWECNHNTELCNTTSGLSVTSLTDARLRYLTHAHATPYSHAGASTCPQSIHPPTHAPTHPPSWPPPSHHCDPSSEITLLVGILTERADRVGNVSLTCFPRQLRPQPAAITVHTTYVLCQVAPLPIRCRSLPSTFSRARARSLSLAPSRSLSCSLARARSVSLSSSRSPARTLSPSPAHARSHRSATRRSCGQAVLEALSLRAFNPPRSKQYLTLLLLHVTTLASCVRLLAGSLRWLLEARQGHVCVSLGDSTAAPPPSIRHSLSCGGRTAGRACQRACARQPRGGRKRAGYRHAGAG